MSVNCMSICFISWNVEGMNGAAIANKVISHLQDLKGDLCFLQETHLCSSELSRIKKQWMGHLFHSRFLERARGVVIIIHWNIAFELSTVVSDSNGRYVMVLGKLQDTSVVLASIYIHQTGTMINSFLNFSQIFPTLLINILSLEVISTWFKIQNLTRPWLNNLPSKSVNTLKFHMNQSGLTDPWRTMQPRFFFFLTCPPYLLVNSLFPAR